MKFSSTKIAGCKTIELEEHQDSRGYFARLWCAKEVAEAGLPGTVVQCSISYNRSAGTLRGMHFQLPPSAEGKFVRCIRGSIFDAIVDLRVGMGSYLETITIKLDDRDRGAVYVPPGCAHGFQTLEDETEILYMMSDVYEPELSRGFRWNDPAFGIHWPLPDPILHERDAKYEDFDKALVEDLVWA